MSYCRPWDEIPEKLLDLSDKELERFDIALLNIALARGLDGAEQMVPDSCLDKLEIWADLVYRNTIRWWPQFLAFPANFDHSPGQFRMMALVTTLQKHLGVHYHLPFSEGEYDASDSRNLFLHGILSGHGGTCATMPVLYAAIGRRLDYPLHLVMAWEHLFVRWEEPDGERFNVECTSRGFVSHDDEHYLQYPKPFPPNRFDPDVFLKNLTRREEIAEFLHHRGQCLKDNLRFREAEKAYYSASRFWPDMPGLELAWGTASLFVRAVEQTRKDARTGGNSSSVLSALPFPEPREPWEHDMLPHARRDLQRLARIQARKAEIRKRARIEFRKPVP